MCEKIMLFYRSVLKQHPVVIQGLQAGVLMGLGDVVSQKIIEEKSQWDWKRSTRFFVIGTFYIGPVLRVWYGTIDRRFGHGSAAIALKKVASDQLLFTPIFIASILSLIGFSEGNSWQQNENNLKRDYTDVLIKNYMVWPPVQMVNFYLVPLNYQVLVAQVVALFWNTFLSWKTHQNILE